MWWCFRRLLASPCGAYCDLAPFAAAERWRSTIHRPGSRLTIETAGRLAAMQHHGDMTKILCQQYRTAGLAEAGKGSSVFSFNTPAPARRDAAQFDGAALHAQVAMQCDLGEKDAFVKYHPTWCR